jgi:hypothetical protein
LRQRKQVCRRNACAHLPMYEDDNCVHECVSTACYREVYASEPVRVCGARERGPTRRGRMLACAQLEPGEIDMERLQKFNTCVLDEMMRASNDRKAQAQADAAAATAEGRREAEGSEEDAS